MLDTALELGHAPADPGRGTHAHTHTKKGRNYSSLESSNQHRGMGMSGASSQLAVPLIPPFVCSMSINPIADPSAFAAYAYILRVKTDSTVSSYCMFDPVAVIAKPARLRCAYIES